MDLNIYIVEKKETEDRLYKNKEISVSIYTIEHVMFYGHFIKCLHTQTDQIFCFLLLTHITIASSNTKAIEF